MHKNPSEIQNALLCWFKKHGRKDLPWQKNKTPYSVWVSEIMLQQTQVSTVIPYFIKFISRFPTIEHLALAPEDEVLHLWTGLGYYSRARNLHRCAKIICETHQGQIPRELAALENLPGIGRSTAGAILALGFKKKATILDGNVKRVLSRLFAIKTWPGEKKTQDDLWKIATTLTPTQKVDEYTQAIMDLGATLCVRGQPRCTLCPLKSFCSAHFEGIEKTLPSPKPKKKQPIKQTTLLLLQKGTCILLEKRPLTGVWGGLFSLPEVSGHVLDEKTLRDHCKHSFQSEILTVKKLNSFRHTFSHFHLDILTVLLTVAIEKNLPNKTNTLLWYNLKNPPSVGLPGPIKKLFTTMS